MKRLVQLIPSHHRHDAAGAEVLTIERLMRAAGWQVCSYADNVDEGLEGGTLPFEQLDCDGLEGAVALYHYCAASEMTWRFAELDCPKAILYHNITPESFFEPYDKDVATDCREGRRQLEHLAPDVDLAIAHSDFSRRDLLDAGFDVTRTIPYLFDPERYAIEPDEELALRLKGGGSLVLFVGRTAPNKAPDDFARVAGTFARTHDMPARFVLAGKRGALPAYERELDELVENMGLERERQFFTGEVSQAELIGLYRQADLFLSLSRHEGFCVPLLEAMHFGVPVAALARGAVPETVGQAGLLFDTTDPMRIADLVFRALYDEDLRTVLKSRARRRLERYALERWALVLRALVEEL